jgi:hypothetical protein
MQAMRLANDCILRNAQALADFSRRQPLAPQAGQV